jgi:hypothetical protein
MNRLDGARKAGQGQVPGKLVLARVRNCIKVCAIVLEASSILISLYCHDCWMGLEPATF